MKIVVLDGYTLNPGDLTWERISEMGDLTVYEHTPPEMTYERIEDAEIVFTNKTIIDKPLLSRLGKLRYIGVLATGYNVVDIEYARERNITVTNIPTYGTYSVMQAVFAMILHFTNHIKEQHDSVLRGEWVNSRDFCYYTTPLTELYGKTLGIIGFGRIGRGVARTADAFGMKVLVYDRFCSDSEIQISDLNDLFRESDFISLHCPLTSDTQGMINTERLSMMKKTAVLINTSRGGLIVEKDLAEALNSNKIAGAALDVLSTEPPMPDNPLLGVKNCVITPHVAWASREARERLMEIAADNLKRFLADAPVNVVSL